VFSLVRSDPDFGRAPKRRKRYAPKRSAMPCSRRRVVPSVQRPQPTTRQLLALITLQTSCGAASNAAVASGRDEVLDPDNEYVVLYVDVVGVRLLSLGQA
jgi:hypothetical protein